MTLATAVTNLSAVHLLPPFRARTRVTLLGQAHESKNFDVNTNVGSAGGFQIHVLSACELSDKLTAEWDAMRVSSDAYRSPFFSHQFVTAVSRRVSGVQIAVASEGGETVGIFPFQCSRGRIARPVGVGINDAHGMLTCPGSNLRLSDVLEACGLNSFIFHAAPVGSCGQHFEMGRTKAFLADLNVDPRGYESFLREQSHTIDRQGQKTRRMIRELGPLRFDFDCRDRKLLQHLLKLKSAQYRRTHIFDLFGIPWIRELLDDLHQNPDADVRGILNVLYAGETPVALHFGMVEGNLLHYWFPVFDPKYAYASPGTQLFLEVARRAAELGINAIDMGYGEQPYKHKLTNVISEMSFGMVDDNGVRRALHRQKLGLRKRLKELRIKDSIKPVARRLFPGLGKSAFEG